MRILAAALAALSVIAAPDAPAQTPKAKGGGAPPTLKINVAECENKIWADMPGGMSPLVELEGAATLPECASVALGATKHALTASSGLAAAAKGLSLSVDLAGKFLGEGLIADAVGKVLQAAIESGGTLDGFTDKLGDAALEKGAESLGGALGFGANAAGGKLTPEQDDLLKKLGENLWKVLKSQETVQTHRDTFRFGACDGEFVVTVTAAFGDAKGEVRIAASGDCHCTEMRGGVRVGKFSVVGVAPLTFGDLHKTGKNEWSMSCSLGGPQYYVWAPCCQASGDHWTSPGPTPPPSTAPLQPSPDERKRAADRRAIDQRCDPDGEKGAAVARAQLRYDLLRAENADDKALDAARAKLAEAQKPLCDCLGKLRNDPALAGDAGLLALLDETLALYCAPPATYVRPVPPPRKEPVPCEADRDFYERARQRWLENTNDPRAEISMANAKKALCECLRRLHGGKLPADLEAFCDPKSARRALAAPPLAAVTPTGPAQDALVGVVVPARTHRDERTTITITTDPKKWEKVPDVVVLTGHVPLRKGPDGKPTLEGTTVTVGGGPSRPATGPVPCDVPHDGKPPVVVTPAGGKPVPIGEIPVAPGDAPPPPAKTTGPATCSPGGTIVVHGPFTGDGRATRVTVGGRLVPVAAATPREIVVTAPADLPVGPAEVVVRDGVREWRLVVPAIRLKMSADKLDLLRGESTPFRVAVEGLGTIPESMWAGGPDAATLDRSALDRLAPGYRVPPPGGPGHLVLLIENGSKGTVTIRGAANEALVLTIERAAAASGTYEYRGTIQSLKDGTFRISGTVVPLLAPPPAEEVR